MASESLPLTGVRVIDLIDGPMQTVGRLLADLGAEVIRKRHSAERTVASPQPDGQ